VTIKITKQYGNYRGRGPVFHDNVFVTGNANDDDDDDGIRHTRVPSEEGCLHARTRCSFFIVVALLSTDGGG